MAQIDTGLLLLVVVAVIAVIGLIIALQSTSGRKRLADAALRLAESLIAYAIGWLERNQPGGVDPAILPAGWMCRQRRLQVTSASPTRGPHS